MTASTDSGRPLIIANPVLPADQRNFDHAFNTAAVATTPYAACQNANASVLYWGNAAKDVYRGPGLNLLALTKSPGTRMWTLASKTGEVKAALNPAPSGYAENGSDPNPAFCTNTRPPAFT